MHRELIFKQERLTVVANHLLPELEKCNVIALHGEMGAGKTTLVAALCQVLGSEDLTGSPTFSIINQYQTRNGKTIYHMDWYRLKDEEEAIAAGVEDALYSGNICLVEWPDRAPAILPDDTLHLLLSTIDEDTRKLTWL
jgi:tRNA threonylcarbamoyladenosine biosynthesis protein TsaE